MNVKHIVSLKFPDGTVVKDITALKSAFDGKCKDILKFIENGELEDFFHSMADMITSMKEEGKPREEILKFFAEILGVRLTEEEIEKAFDTEEFTVKDIELSKTEAEQEYVVTKDLSLKESLVNDKTSLRFPDGEWTLEESVTIKSAKKITGFENTIFNINALTIDVPVGETVSFENIDFKKIDKTEALIRILNGNVLFNNVLFNGVRVEAVGNSKMEIKSSNFTHVATAILGKEKALLDLEDVSFEKINKKMVVIKDCADMVNPVDFVNKYPDMKEGLLCSRTVGVKLLKEGLTDFSKLLSSVKDIKLSGEFNIKELITINAETLSIEGDCGGRLILRSNLKQAFLIKNNGTLKCKNVIFECMPQKKEIKEQAMEEIGEEDKEQKETGFIHFKSGNLEMNECKLLHSDIGICLEEHSKADIKHCHIMNNVKTGIDIRASKAKITFCNLEGNGEKGKNYPQIGIDNNSDVEIRDTNVSNSSNSDGIYIYDSKVSIHKCTINNNNNGLDIRDNSDVKVFESEFNANREEGIYIYYNSRATVKKCRIINNKSNGFDIRDNSDVEISDSKINGNIRGIDIKASKVNVSDCEVNGNVKGIYMDLNSAAEVRNCKVTNSKMHGFYVDSSRLKISDCEIRKNGEEDEDNFQVYIGKKSKVEIVNSVISEAGKKLNDVFSEFEGSKILTEDCQIEAEIKYGHKKNGCFITTATCLSLNKPDNCCELTILRDFRDNWLIHQEGGENLIEEYYSVAPDIVNNIDKLPQKDRIYKEIWDNYLSGCLYLIEKKDFDMAKTVYVKMIETLKGKYSMKKVLLHF